MTPDYLTGHGAIDTALEAIKLGAYDYLTKPCEVDELVEKIEDAREKNNNNNGGGKSILGALTNGIRKR